VPVLPKPPASEILAAMSDRPGNKKQVAPKTNEWASSRSMRFLVAFILILAFAGMLWATHNYFRGRISLWGSRPSTSTPASTVNADVGREVFTVTDVFLRPDPGTSNLPIGLAETGSRVRVLNANSNWYEVQILEHGRPPDNGKLNAERGWVNKRFLKLDS
jgi:hypothetical protein